MEEMRVCVCVSESGFCKSKHIGTEALNFLPKNSAVLVLISAKEARLLSYCPSSTPNSACIAPAIWAGLKTLMISAESSVYLESQSLVPAKVFPKQTPLQNLEVYQFSNQMEI